MSLCDLALTLFDESRLPPAEELARRGHWTQHGEERIAPVLFQQPIAEYIESFHSRNGLSRQRMTLEQAAEFDAQVYAALLPYCANQQVALQVGSLVQWGTPH